MNASSQGNTVVTARRSRHVRSAAQNRSRKAHCAARSMFFPMQCCAPRASCGSNMPRHIQQLVQAVGRHWAISVAPAGAAAAESLLVIIAATDALATADLSELEDAFSRTAASR